MNGWKLINESDENGMEWHGSDVEESSEEGSDEEGESDAASEPEPQPAEKSKPKKKKKKKQDKSKWTRGKAQASVFDEHPKPIEDEDFSFYYTRTEQYWTKLMSQACQELFD